MWAATELFLSLQLQPSQPTPRIPKSVLHAVAMAAFLQQALHQVQNHAQVLNQVSNQVSGMQRPAPQLAPFPQTLGVLPAFYANAPETIVLRENVFSLSGDSFTVATLDGRPVMQVKGEVLSLSGRKHVADPAGQPLFDLRKEHFALHATFVAEAPNSGGNLFQVKSKFKRTYPRYPRLRLDVLGSLLEARASLLTHSSRRLQASVRIHQ